MCGRSLLALWVLLAACKPDAPVASEDAPPATAHSADSVGGGKLPPLASLSLRAALGAASPIEAGKSVPIKVQIVNISDKPVPVVAAGDGSNVGWREPHVFFTGRRVDKGHSRPVGELEYARCGTYDEDWSDEVEVLAPGASLDIHVGNTADQFLDLQAPGAHELEVHYRYTQGKGTKGSGTVPAVMAQMPAFELVSNTLKLAVTRPLDVRLEATGSLDAGASKAIDDVFRVVVNNDGGDPRDVGSPTEGEGHELYFHVAADGVTPPDIPRREGQAPKKVLLPGKSAAVLGKDSIFAPSFADWTVQKRGKVRVHVEYQGIRSNWVTVVVR